MARERGRLGRDPLLEVAVGDDRERVVIDDLVAGTVEPGGEHVLRQRHPDSHRDSLAERAGGRLDPERQVALRVAGRRIADLAEVLDVLQRQRVPGQEQARVQEHRGVPGRQDESVAVPPERVGGVVAHHPREQRVGDRGQAHRRARVSGVRLLDGVDRERADRVHAQLVEPDPVLGLFGRGQRRARAVVGSTTTMQSKRIAVRVCEKAAKYRCENDLSVRLPGSARAGSAE